MLSIIVAVSKNNVIGKDNKLPWNIPEDLKHFRKLTTGHTIIMGRKTFESIGKVLPNRHHIVISRNFSFDNPNVEVVRSIKDVEKYIKGDTEYFIIGGASIYKELLPLVENIYMTRIDVEIDGDSYFPEIDERDWKIVSKEKGKLNSGVRVEYITYERI